MLGIDLYENNNPYPWKSGENFTTIIPRDRDDNLMNVINKYHPKEIQIEALLLAKAMPGVKLYSLSGQSPINKYIDSGKIQNNNDFTILDKEPNAIKDWLDLPTIEEETIKYEQKDNFKKINFIQKIFSVKNEDTHKVLRLMGIKFKFKRKQKNKQLNF